MFAALCFTFLKAENAGMPLPTDMRFERPLIIYF
jgi:hypothetical protein